MRLLPSDGIEKTESRRRMRFISLDVTMFDTTLIESANLQGRQGNWVTTLLSALIHTLVIGGLFMAGYFYEEKNKVIETRIEAFLVGGDPAPPPPPPPPPATSSTPRPVKAKVEIPETPTESFVTPTRIEELPDVEIEETEATEPVEGGVPGGVEGGVPGGVVGGEVGGVIGGTLGGKIGGVLGGTGDQAFPVGGNVKAPVPIHRVEPGYTEPARRERIEGVVILEAIIDRSGSVTDVRVLKPLPNGLSEEAIAAVKQWKFRPGTRDGQPVPVIFTLTIKFRLG